MTKRAQQYIQQLDLAPHPEGGFYKRIYQSPINIETLNGERPLSTSIHYLLEQGDYSAWHRIKSDELWYYNDGGQLNIHTINQQGQLSTYTLGKDDQLHVCISANTWFCAELSGESNSPFILTSCVVSPGFDFEDFEMANTEDLVTIYPQHRDIICRLCRE